MRRLTRAWPGVLVALLLALACGGGSPTSPSTPWFQIKNCELPNHGALTADLDGAPWMPVSARASGSDVGGGITLDASDCRHALMISIERFKGPGTYDVAGGDVFVDFRCDGNPCGIWKAGNGPPQYGTNYGGSGSVTVTGYTARTPGGEPSGAIEGTFSFTLVSLGYSGATGTRVVANGRFRSRFWGL